MTYKPEEYRLRDKIVGEVMSKVRTMFPYPYWMKPPYDALRGWLSDYIDNAGEIEEYVKAKKKKDA